MLVRDDDMKNILLIDDDHDVRKVIGMALTEDGFAVTGARDGAEALGMLDKQSPDLLILDLVMPNMNGFEFMRKVRQSWPDLPIIVLSGHIEKETEQIIEDLGGNHFIRKPLEFDALRQIIDSVS